MIKRLLLASLTMILPLCGTCGQSQQPLFKSVDVATFEGAVADSTFVVLDVRTAAEYAEGHIAGTHFNIDVTGEGFTEEALRVLPKGRSVALYCRSGNRSKRAAQILAESGYTVLELGTGYRGWASAGKPTEK